MLLLYFLSFPFFFLASVNAVPAKCPSNQVWNGVGCITKVCSKAIASISSANQQASATAFCSSYLSIPLATRTTTLTDAKTITVTSGTVTTTVATLTYNAITTSTLSSSTTTITVIPSTTTTTTTTSTVIQTTPCVAPPLPQKKRANSFKGPKPHRKSKKIPKSACSCLSITPSTTTVTVRPTATVTIPSTVTAAVSTKSISTKYETITIRTTTTLAKVTKTATATATATVLNNFKIYIRGNEQEGSYITDQQRNAPAGSAVLGAAGSTSIADGDTFSIDGTGNLVLVSGKIVPAGYIAVQGQVVQDVSLTAPGTAGTFKVTCTASLTLSNTCPLTCTGDMTGSSASYIDSPFWWEIGDGSDNYFTPYAVSV